MANYSSVDTLYYDIRATITPKSGSAVSLTSQQISMYDITDQLTAEGIPLGTTASVQFALTFDNTAAGLTAAVLDDATVHVEISQTTTDTTVWSDFGVWFVDASEISEQSPFITISGYDALNTRFNDIWASDSATYPRSLLLIAQSMCALAGVTLATNTFYNHGVSVATKPNWPEECTTRDIIGWIAACAAGYARMNYSGQLEIVALTDATQHTVGPRWYTELAGIGGASFNFNAIEYKFADDDDYTRYAIDEEIADNATNTVQMDGNPLMTDDIANSIVAKLDGAVFSSASMHWFGGVAVQGGDVIEITDLSDNTRTIIITSQSVTFTGGGMAAATECAMPSVTAETSSFSTGASVFDSSGRVRAGAVAELDKSVVSASAAYFGALTADTVNASQLLANIINAVSLKAQNINASSVSTDILTAAAAEIIDATIRKLEAETVTTDELYAAIADVVKLRVGQIDAQSISTDQLAAVLGDFVTLYAQTGEFDFATAQNFVAGAMILTQGVGGSVYIENLAATSASFVSATLGELCLKGEDDNYYDITVGSDGTIHTAQRTVTAAEIAAGETTDGHGIVETTANIADLNAQTVKAQSAIISDILVASLTAEKITAQEALLSSATVPELYVTAIKAIGDNIMVQASNAITLAITDAQQTADDANATAANVRAWMRFSEDGLEQGKDGSTYSTLVDDTGFHVLQKSEKISSFAKRQLAVEEVRVGKVNSTGTRCILREAYDGGMIVTVEGLT